MTSSRRLLRTFLLASILLLGSVSVSFLPHPYLLACGPFFPNSYLVFGGREILQMPPAMFWVECLDILELTDSLGSIGREDLRPESLEEQFQMSIETDLADLEEALREWPESDFLIGEYRSFRVALAEEVKALIPMRWEAPKGSIDAFDLEPYRESLSRLPAEFREYSLGAEAFHEMKYDDAASHFSRLLELPSNGRAYRSTWASFMLGKCLLKLNRWEEAVEAFERTRELTESGFRDPLGLAGDSLGWQARAELLRGNFVRAIHQYAAFWRDNPRHSWPAFLSLKRLCSRALGEDSPKLDELARDELSRNVVTAWLASHRDIEEQAGRWIAALSRFEPEGIVRRADRLAWSSYRQGAMGQARRWLNYSDPGSPYAAWVQAKLLLREGRLDEGTQILRSLADRFPVGPGYQIESPSGNFAEPTQAREAAFGDLAYLLAKQGHYREALTAFLREGSWADAALLAERILTPEELENHLKALDSGLFRGNKAPEERRRVEETFLPRLYFLLARRWARLGRWEKALQALPRDEESFSWRREGAQLLPLMGQLADHLNKAESFWRSDREKAQHLFEAAKILREYGMELTGTELSPDWAMFEGAYDDFSIGIIDVSSLQGGALPPGSDFVARYEASSADPDERFHYRYRAAELMWRSAQLLPDNDVLTAHALYLGGTYLKGEDVRAADRFYKALVRRNPNLLIARQADKLRWFPQEFTNEVLYHSPPRIPSKERIVFFLLTTVLIEAGMVWLIRRPFRALPDGQEKRLPDLRAPETTPGRARG